MFEIGEEPKNPIKFMFTKVGSCDTILFSKLELSSMEIRQQWHERQLKYYDSVFCY